MTEDYIRQRDFESVEKYEAVSLKKEAKPFLDSKSVSCKAYGVHILAVDAIRNGNYEKARELLDREKFILDSLRCKQTNYLENTISFGDYYLRTGDFKGAIDYYNKAMRWLQRIDNKNLQTQVLLSLSNAHSKLKQEDKATRYLYQAHPLVGLLPNGHSKVESLYNLSSRYYYQYQSKNDVALLDSAQHAATFGIQLARLIGYEEGFIRGYNLLEDKEYHDKNYRMALIYLDSALYFTQPVANASERCGIYSDMADIYLKLKKYEKAYICADSSLSCATQMGSPYRMKDALELLYNCSKLSGEYERALNVYEDLVTMRDSVTKLESIKAYSELEDKYHRRAQQQITELEEEQDRKLMEKQREIGNLRSKLITVGIIISALLLCYILIIFRQKNMRSKQKRLEVEQRLQRARINPDFIYNALTSLQGMAANQANSSDMAKKLASFTKLVKQTLDSSHDDFLTLDKEIEFLTYYMELQRDRLNNSFSFRIDADSQLNQKDVCLPTMILQPFIENTIERGFKGLSHEGMINISFDLSNGNELHIKIQDNGKGLKAADSNRASEIINDRLYLLNKISKTNSSFLIRERSSGGVSVEIFLPLITREMTENRRD